MKLYAYQEKIIHDTSRFVLAGMARQTGKDVTAIQKLLRVKGESMIVFPIESQKNAFLNAIKPTDMDTKSGTKIKLVKDGPWIHLKSASKVSFNDFVGKDHDTVIFMEPAYYENDGILLDMLKATRVNQVLYIGTPRPNKHKYDMFTVLYRIRDWAGISTHEVDSGEMVKEAHLQKMKANMLTSNERWRAEVMGKFSV